MARERIQASDFYRLEHQLIFRAMCRLYEDNQGIDPITIADFLTKSGTELLDRSSRKT